jgi:hypothetical protein
VHSPPTAQARLHKELLRLQADETAERYALLVSEERCAAVMEKILAAGSAGTAAQVQLLQSTARAQRMADKLSAQEQEVESLEKLAQERKLSAGLPVELLQARVAKVRPGVHACVQA